MLLHYKELKKLIKPSFNIYIANNAMVNVFLALFIKVWQKANENILLTLFTHKTCINHNKTNNLKLVFQYSSCIPTVSTTIIQLNHTCHIQMSQL